MPINSVPTDGDGDEDGIPDKWDKNALKKGAQFGNENDVINSGGSNKYVFQTLKTFTSLNNYPKKSQYLKIYALPSTSESTFENNITENSVSVERVVLSKNLSGKAIDYWLKISLENGKYGYIKYNDITGSIVDEIDKVKARKVEYPVGQEGKPMNGFAGWYVPEYGVKGVTKPIPRFLQNRAGKCLALSMMMGLFYVNNFPTSDDAAYQYYNNEIFNSYDDDYGAQWKGKINYTQNLLRPNDSKKPLLDELKVILNTGKPAIISGHSNENRYDHFVLVVGYKNDGTKESDFIVVDPMYSASVPITAEIFWKEYYYITEQFNGDPFPNSNYPIFYFL